MRVVGLNSSEVAAAVRSGDIEAGLVQLPVDSEGLSVGPPVLVDEVVYVSTDPERVRNPVTIEYLADAPLILSEVRWSDSDPLRVRLAERTQRAGVTLSTIAEVEFQTHALELAAHGVGDSLVSYLVAKPFIETQRLGFAQLDPPLFEHFAFITRKSGAQSPATLEFMVHARQRIAQLQLQLQLQLDSGLSTS